MTSSTSLLLTSKSDVVLFKSHPAADLREVPSGLRKAWIVVAVKPVLIVPAVQHRHRRYTAVQVWGSSTARSCTLRACHHNSVALDALMLMPTHTSAPTAASHPS
jgi:hypothetical protein